MLYETETISAAFSVAGKIDSFPNCEMEKTHSKNYQNKHD